LVIAFKLKLSAAVA